MLNVDQTDNSITNQAIPFNELETLNIKLQTVTTSY